MLTTFESVKPYLKFKSRQVSIDNFFFQLHYRLTFVILLIAMILVTSRQYIGEHIKCISDTIPEEVINSFCFISTTFTVVRHLNNSALESGAIFHPGIGTELQDEPVKRHAYYQWVPFVLFGQALSFMVPHYLWKHWEGGNLKQLLFGLRRVDLSWYLQENLKIGDQEIPSKEKTEERIKSIRGDVVNRMRLTREWGFYLQLAEWLNLINILVQIWWINRFLAGQFYGLGWKVLREEWHTRMDVLDVVFPKMTKCHFSKFGPSGSLQVHDTLCVMALNIINEKIYTILWFWFLFVLLMSCIAVIWRMFTMFMFKRQMFSEIVFGSTKSGGKLHKRHLDDAVKRCNFSSWTFLYFLALNLPASLFSKVIENLADDFPTGKEQQSRDVEIQAELIYPVVHAPLLLEEERTS